MQIVEAKEKLNAGRLSTTGGSDQSDLLSLFDRKRKVPQDLVLPPTGVSKIRLVEAQVASDRRLKRDSI